MDKKTLLAIANETAKILDSHENDLKNGIKLSLSDWMTWEENSKTNRFTYAKTEAKLDIYRQEAIQNSPADDPDAVVFGDERYKAFPQLERLRAVRDEKDALYAELTALREEAAKRKAAAAKRKPAMETIPEENEEEEKISTQRIAKDEAPKKPEDAKTPQAKKEAERKAEIDEKLSALNEEWTALNQSYREFLKAQESENIKERNQKAQEEKREDLKAYAEAEDEEFTARIGLLCAAKAALQKRTFKDYLFHPFRSIGENMRYREMKSLFLSEFDVTERELDAVVKTVGDGDPNRLCDVTSIGEDGEIEKAKAKETVAEEPQIGEPKEEIKPEEKEELEEQLKGDFLSVEKGEMSVRKTGGAKELADPDLKRN